MGHRNKKMKNDWNKFNLKAWKKYGGRKIKGSFGVDDSEVEGTLRKTRNLNVYKLREKGKLRSYKITDSNFNVNTPDMIHNPDSYKTRKKWIKSHSSKARKRELRKGY